MTLNTVYKVGHTAVLLTGFVGACGYVAHEIGDTTECHIKNGENEKVAMFEAYGAGVVAGAALGMLVGKAIANTWGL